MSTILDALQLVLDAGAPSERVAEFVKKLAETANTWDDEDEAKAVTFYAFILDNEGWTNPDDIDEAGDGFSIGSREWNIYTDDEADAAAKEYVEESLWAFNSDFLAAETELPAEAFTVLSEKCEDGNDGILAMVRKTCGLDAFTKAATSADGRGHFLSQYDGHEHEAGEYFVYRTN